MKTYTLHREIPVEDGCDLVVAGGGPAGTAAAVCAARLGAKVLLLEATGCLGGMGTSGLVTAFDPMADGEKGLVGGLMREIVETLHARGELGPDVTPDYWLNRYHVWTPFRVEGLKRLLDELTADAGVDVRLFTTVVEADAGDRHVRGVVIHNIEGLRYVRATAFVDATGDAVLADLCGVPCRTNPEFMPGTLCSLHAGIDWSRLREQRQQERLEEAIADGHFTQPDRHLPGMSRVGRTIGYLNGGHLFGADALTCRGRTEGMRQGRRLVNEYVEFYRRYVDGCQDIELVTTAALMGVRETRRIIGEYELTFDDYIARRQFPDQIGVFNKFVDIHVRDCSEAEYARFTKEMSDTGRLGPGECFGLPYRILVPKGWRNLWVAGRCNSSDIPVHGSIRVMPAAAMMGQAAGTAAVQALRTGRAAFDVDTGELVRSLREQGAWLPQDETAAGEA
ncbi:MAG: FAD-dependent oxidoreductase [Planctomycetota bacterium]